MYQEKTPKSSSKQQKTINKDVNTVTKHRGGAILCISLGCPRNRVHTEVMLSIILKAGYTIVNSVYDADYIVITTCGFLEAARTESLEITEEIYEEKSSRSRTLCNQPSNIRDVIFIPSLL